MPDTRPDLMILGGGLSAGLLALAMAARRPKMTVAIVEAGDRIGGNHIWSFFAGDVSPEQRWLVDPLIVHRWPAYDVRFPSYGRTIAEAYHSITSERLDEAVRAALPEGAIIRGSVESADAREVALADGRTLEAGSVIDMRGAGDLSALSCGWQKFVGEALSLSAPHGVARPVVMDATVEQADGYRFVYLLPFGERELFVEDTYYSDQPDLDIGAIRDRIAAYVAARGWTVATSTRLETGVLPVVTLGDFEDYWPASDGLPRGGVRAGLFHPLTSYSLPDAVRFAVAFADDPSLDTRAYAARHWGRAGFSRMLARMLMRAAEPDRRYRILERFYSLPAPLIARFYAGRSTLWDRLRILAGKPPVPVSAAIRALRGTR
jgi:lycopene beta-cyclase